MSNEKKHMLDMALVGVRDFLEEDVEGLMQYWSHSPEGYIAGLGSDPRKLSPEQEFQTWLIGEANS